MVSVNRVIIAGNVGREPEVRFMPNGRAVANIAVATTESWKDKNSGERQESTEWHRVVFYDKLAEVVGEHVKKGSPLYIEGRLKTRKWTDKENIERYTTEIVADNMQFLSTRPASGNDAQDDDYGQGSSSAPEAAAPAANKKKSSGKKSRAPQPAPDLDGDDIPF